jgi:hypothetical protein
VDYLLISVKLLRMDRIQNDEMRRMGGEEAVIQRE